MAEGPRGSFTVPLELEPGVIYRLNKEHGYIYCPETKDSIRFDRESTKIINDIWSHLVLGGKAQVTAASVAGEDTELVASLLVVKLDSQ